MNELSTTGSSIEQITVEIILLKEQTARNIIEIGRRLIQVKDQLQHGEWGRYLAERVEFSERSARNFMRVAREFSNRQTFADLPPSKVFALLDVPAEEREQFVATAHVVDGETKTVDMMSARELQKVIKERNELREELDAARSAEEETQAEMRKLQEQVENERKRTKDEVNRLSALLDEARKSGAALERVAQLEVELSEARRQVDLLKEAPVAAAAQTPDQVALTATKYRVHFDAVVAGFKSLMADLGELKAADADAHSQYRQTLIALLQRMQSAI